MASPKLAYEALLRGNVAGYSIEDNAFEELDIESKMSIALQRATKFVVSNKREQEPTVDSNAPFEWVVKVKQDKSSLEHDSNILDSTCFLIHFACLLDRLKAANKFNQIESKDSRLFNTLACPELIVEFRREQRDYCSAIRLKAKDSKVKELLKPFQDERQLIDNQDDEEAYFNKIQLATTLIDPVDKRDDNPWIKFETLNEKYSSITGQGELVASLLQHLTGIYDVVDSKDSQQNVNQVNSFHRAKIKNWQNQLETFAHAQNDPINCYPFLTFYTDVDEEYLILVCATQIDQLFVDERVRDDRKLPGVTLAIYPMKEIIPNLDKTIVQLSASFRNTIGRLSMQTMAYKRGQALEAAAGEASKISRFWYGQGVIKLFETNQNDGALSSKTVYDFWTDFVVELLCAKVDGVEFTEVFPFDRAYIFSQTGIDEKSEGKKSVEVRVLEAALESRESNTRFEYLTSMERGSQGLDDCDVTAKIVKYHNSISLYQDAAKRWKIALLDKGIKKNVQGFTLPKLKDTSSDIDMLLGSILNSTNGEFLNLDQKNMVKSIFDREGILYSYKHGLNLESEMEILSSINNAYIQSVSKIDDISLEETKGTQAKAVLISFDPKLSQTNRVDELDSDSKTLNDSRYLGVNETFALLLVADEDPEKSLMELSAERDDLELLVRMIIRQKLREKRLERGHIRQKIDVITGAMDSFLHDIKRDMNKEQKRSIDRMWSNMSKLLQFKGEEASKLVIKSDEKFENGSDLLSFILDCDKTNVLNTLRSQVNEYAEAYRNDISNLQLPTLRYLPSFIPDLSLHVPLDVVKNAFKVMLTNAVEATLDERCKGKQEIVVSVASHPIDSKWTTKIIIENTMAGVSKEVLDKLQSPKPITVGKNAEKGSYKSNGIGVYAARTLLENGIGGDASIEFILLNKLRMQVVLTLPSHLESQPTISAEESGPINGVNKNTKDYILYLEDDEQIAEDMLDSAGSLVEQSDISISWCKSASEAKAALEELGLPILFMTDLSVPNKLGGEALVKNSLSVIKVYFKKCKENLKKPPIWILSNNSTEDILDNISGPKLNVSDSNYVISEQIDNQRLLESGVITLLANIKTISEEESLIEGIQNLTTENVAGIENNENLKSDNKGLESAKVQVFESQLHAKNFTQQLWEYFEANKLLSAEVEQQSFFVAKSTVNSLEELSESLCTWFYHEGIPDLDEPDDEPCVLSDCTYHQKLFLHMVCNEKLLNKISYEFRYWCLTHNIVFTREELSSVVVAEHWSHILNNKNGVLSRVRHDISNIKKSSNFRDFATVILNDINRLEDKFRWKDAKLSTKLDELLSQDTEFEGVKHWLKANELKQNITKELYSSVVQILDGLIEQLLTKTNASNDYDNTIAPIVQTYNALLRFKAVMLGEGK